MEKDRSIFLPLSIPILNEPPERKICPACERLLEPDGRCLCCEATIRVAHARLKPNKNL